MSVTLKEKTKFQQLSNNFEHYCVQVLSDENDKTNWYHWTKVPHEVLFESGYIHGYHQYRKRVLQSYKDGNTIRDVGVDFIGKIDNHFIFGQSKLYDSNVTYSDASTWLSKTLVSRQHNPLNTGLLCTINGISLELQGDIQYAGLDHKKLEFQSFENWNTLQKKKQVVSSELNLVRRDYQLDTVKRAVEYINNNEVSKVVIQMCCGLGKTVILGDILRGIVPSYIIMMAPFKTDVQNLHARIPSLIRAKYELVLFDSDESVDMDELVKKIEYCVDKKKRLLIFTTFKSASEKIANYLYSGDYCAEYTEEYIIDNDEEFEEDDTESEEENEDAEDSSEEDEPKLNEVKNVKVVSFLQHLVIVVDECHELPINNKPLLQFINESKKAIFTTATLPKTFKKYVAYNLLLDEYNFKYALENKYIADYKIMIPMRCEDVELSSIVNTSLESKAAFLMKGMLQTGSRKCIVYVSTKQECIHFMDAWKRIGKDYHGRKTCSFRINDDTTYVQRKEIIKSFEDTLDDCLTILINCRCLNQAVDIPKCDSTFITNISETSSEIVMFQRFMRASRLYAENSQKLNHCFLWIDDNDISSLESCLMKLKSGLQDACFDKKVRIISESYDCEDNKETREKVVTLQKEMDIKLVEWIDADSRWEKRLKEVEEYIIKHKKRPSYRGKDVDEKIIGYWLANQIINYNRKKKGMKDETRKKAWDAFTEKYKQYFLTDDEVWKNNLQLLEEYIIKYKKRPSRNSTDIQDTIISNWLYQQIKNYKQEKDGMKDERRKKVWDAFTEKYKKYFLPLDEMWKSNLQLVEEYIIKHKKRPSSSSNDADEKNIGDWLSHQIRNYNREKDSMKNERKKIWESFTEKYKKYFLTYEDEWRNNLQLVEEYIIKHKERPSEKSKDVDEKIIGCWLTTQVTNYKRKKKGMKDERRRKVWESFTEKYKQYFLSNDEVWKNNLQLVEEYIIKHKSRPSYGSKNVDEKVIGGWLAVQVTNYKQDKYGMKDERRRKAWEFFTEKYKQYL